MHTRSSQPPTQDPIEILIVWEKGGKVSTHKDKENLRLA